ncbi:MAG: VOC family protein [Acidobacteriaceae bacterium]
MTRVTGIGGVFLKAKNPAELSAWYGEHLGLPLTEWGGADFEWREKDSPEKIGKTVWSLFPADSNYFGAGTQQTMLNFRVNDLDAMLEHLAAQGIQVDSHREEHPYGRFAWIVDPEGNRVELWEPLNSPDHHSR